MTFSSFLNKEVLNAQEIFSKKEKHAWEKFQTILTAKYEGKGSRAVKFKTVESARISLKEELKSAEDEYARAVGSTI